METKDNEAKKDYLKSYLRAKKRIGRIEQEIQQLRADKMFPSLQIDGMPRGNGKSDLSDFAVLMDEQMERLKAERLKMAKARDSIDRSIRILEDDCERDVLRLRYLLGKTWEQVAVEMGYSWQHVHKIHASALKNLKMR